MALFEISGVKAETVKELRETIIAILSSGQEQKTLRTALKTLEKGVRAPAHTQISGCSFQGPETVTYEAVQSDNEPEEDPED